MKRRRTGQMVATTAKLILTFLLIAALFFLFFGRRTMGSVSVAGDFGSAFSDMADVINDGFKMAGVDFKHMTPEKAVNEVKKATKVLRSTLDDVKEASNIIFTASQESYPGAVN